MKNTEQTKDIFPDLFETIKMNLRDALIDYLRDYPEYVTEGSFHYPNLPDWSCLDISMVYDVIPKDFTSLTNIFTFNKDEIRLDMDDGEEENLESLYDAVEEFFEDKVEEWWETEVEAWLGEVSEDLQEQTKDLVQSVLKQKDHYNQFPI